MALNGLWPALQNAFGGFMSFGMIILGIWLILTGLFGLGVPSPPAMGMVLAVLALVAGILIIVGR
jgi:hypothetical protein